MKQFGFSGKGQPKNNDTYIFSNGYYIRMKSMKYLICQNEVLYSIIVNILITVPAIKHINNQIIPSRAQKRLQNNGYNSGLKLHLSFT